MSQIEYEPRYRNAPAKHRSQIIQSIQFIPYMHRITAGDGGFARPEENLAGSPMLRDIESNLGLQPQS